MSSKTTLQLGPWATAFDAAPRAQLSRLWRQRVSLLPISAARCGHVRQPGRFALAIFAITVIALPSIERKPAPAAPAATDSPAGQPAGGDKNARVPGQPIRVELPGGAIAEVVAIGPHPSQGQPWWAADGRPVAAPYNSFKSSVDPGEGFFVREIAVRWIEQPQGLALSYGVVGGGSAAAGRPDDAQGKSIPNIYTTAQAFPNGTKTAALKFVIGLGEWETVGTTDGQNDCAIGGPKYSVAFTKTSQRSEGLALSAAHNITKQDVRLIAIDHEGKPMPSPPCSRSGGRGFMQSTGVFPGLKSEEIKEFRLETRPYRFVEVRNISLVANELTEPEVVAVAETSD